MLKVLGVMMIAALAGYAVACLGLYVFQRSFIYYPPPQAALRAPVVSTLAVPGAELRVSERPLPGARAVIYFGGNGEDVSASLPVLDQAFPDRALYLMHYRGYAGSTGKPAERELVNDAVLLFDRVAALHPEVTVVGRSLGTGVALQLAGRRPVRRLVLVTPYDNIVDLAARQFPVFPVRWLLKDKYESGREAEHIRIPTMVVLAEDDEVIPAWSSRRLVSRFAPGIASVKVIHGVGHNTITQRRDYLEALRGGLAD